MTFDPSKSWSLQEELQQLITQIEAVPFWADESYSIWHEETASFWLDDSNSSVSSDNSSDDMNNTKRKFNALLNSIGTSSSDDLTRTTKQARTSYDTLPRSSTSSPNLSTSSRTAAVARMSKTDLKFAAANSAKARGLDEPVTKPSFLPGDREDFLERLATFRNLTDWMPKPPKVNEVAWAKRGWACQRLERVRCVTCNVEIMVKLNKQEDENGKLIKFAGMESDIGMQPSSPHILTGEFQKLRRHRTSTGRQIRRAHDNLTRRPLPLAQTRLRRLHLQAAHLPHHHYLSSPQVTLRLPPPYDRSPPRRIRLCPPTILRPRCYHRTTPATFLGKHNSGDATKPCCTSPRPLRVHRPPSACPKTWIGGLPRLFSHCGPVAVPAEDN